MCTCVYMDISKPGGSRQRASDVHRRALAVAAAAGVKSATRQLTTMAGDFEYNALSSRPIRIVEASEISLG